MTTTRRAFMRKIGGAGAFAAVGDLSFLSKLPIVSAQEAKLAPKIVRLNSGIEPLVRLLEETPRDRLLEEIGLRIRRGLSYRDVLAALLLAGVRNIQPRPVGFKFHAVLVVNSAHLASISCPDSERWLPIFWALDHFKNSQAQDVKEGDWTMGPVEESAVPGPEAAKKAFTQAMDAWDVPAADAAVAGLARTAGANEIFEIFCRYGARDFREIGHKAIYVANSWRTLQCIGWQHAEPVLRSLAYGLLDYDGENPAKHDSLPDRPWRRNLELARTIRKDWIAGRIDDAATLEMLKTLREASYEGACDKAVELLNKGVAPQSIWNALFDGAGELVMRQPGIGPLHAVTSTNALHYAFQQSGNDESRRMLLLQNVAYITLFRGQAAKNGTWIDQLEPEACATREPLAEIFADVSKDKKLAARKALGYLQANPDAQPFIDTARRLVFLKGRDAHDYKFSSAVLEDYGHASEAWRARYLAASTFLLEGSGGADNDLAKRTRAALAG